MFYQIFACIYVVTLDKTYLQAKIWYDVMIFALLIESWIKIEFCILIWLFNHLNNYIYFLLENWTFYPKDIMSA